MITNGPLYNVSRETFLVKNEIVGNSFDCSTPPTSIVLYVFPADK